MSGHVDDADADDELIRRCCDAALRKDAASLAELLRCHNRRSEQQSSLNAPLLNSTQQAQILHQRLFSRASLLPDACRADHLLRALLMVPPAFETPWTAAIHFVSMVQQQEEETAKNNRFQQLTSLRGSMADIQSFLQQTVASWWENERRKSAALTVVSRDDNDGAAASGHIARTTTPRACILRLVEQILRPLLFREEEVPSTSSTLHSSSSSSQARRNINNEHWTAPLELVSTLVSILYDLEYSFQEEILDIVFHHVSKRIRPDRLLPWLSLAMDLHTFLRPSDWKRIVVTLERKDDEKNQQQQQQQQQQYIAFLVPQEDLPGLMSSIVMLSSTVLERGKQHKTKKQYSETREDFHSWRMLALQLLQAASKDSSTFSTVATMFQVGLSSLPSEYVREWVSFEKESLAEATHSSSQIERSESTHSIVLVHESMIYSNMILLAMQAAKKSGSQLVQRVLFRSLSRTTTTTTREQQWDLALEGWEALVVLAFGNEQRVSRTKGNRVSSSKKKWNAERLLEGASYQGNGRFQCDRETTTSLLNRAGVLVYQSLFLESAAEGHTIASRKKSDIYLLERAQGWIYAANNRLKASTQGYLSVKDAVLIAATLVVVFCEVPRSRSFVVRGILKSLLGEIDFIYSKNDIALLHCQAISAIVKASTDGSLSADIPELKPIVDVVAAGKVPKIIFFALVNAIATSSEAADAAILSASRKRLDGPIVNVWWDSNTVNESCDRMQCGLHGLCILIGASKWNVCNTEAWKMLSERIVLNKPPLPLGARSWLFRHLRELLESGTFDSRLVVKKLFRVCLLRLLCFVVKDADSPCKMAISAPSILAVWTVSDSTRSVQSTPVDDVPEIYRLVLDLFFRTAHARPNKQRNDDDILSLGRRFLLQSCLGQNSGDIGPALALTHHVIDNEQQLHCKLAVHLLAIAARFVAKCSSALNAIKAVDAEGCHMEVSSISSIRAALVQQEAAEFEQLGQSQHEAKYTRPSWLEQQNDLRQASVSFSPLPPQAAKQSLALSFANVLSGSLEDHRWTLGSANLDQSLSIETQKDLLLSLNFLSSCKSQLSTDDRGKDSELSYPSHRSARAYCIDAGTLLSSLACVIDDVLAKEEAFLGTSALVSVLMEHLAALKFIGEDEVQKNFANIVLAPIFYGLWQLYVSICQEEAAVRFVSYLEKFSLFEGSSVHLGGSKTLSVDSPEAIDTLVRQIRTSLLVTIQTVLSLMCRHGEANPTHFASSPMLEFSAGETQGGMESYQWSKTASTKPIDFLAGRLQQLASDLYSGMQGHSGGVSVEMYRSFIESMDLISKLLQILVIDESDADALGQVSNSCKESGTKIQNTLCSYPLHKKSSLFQKAFLLCARSLPRTMLCTGRRAMLLGQFSGPAYSTSPEQIGLVGDESFSVQTFKHCIAKLKDWIGSGRPSDTSWAQISVPEIGLIDSNCNLDDDSSDNAPSPAVCPQTSSANTGVPSVVTISLPNESQDRNACTENKNEQTRGNLPLDSKASWTSACSGALVAMESTWLDAYNALHYANHGHDSSKLNFPFSSTATSYMNMRTRELVSIGKALSLVLSDFQPQESQSGREGTRKNNGVPQTEFLVTVMPNSSKLRLCTLMDRMAVVLCSSGKLLESYTRQPLDAWTGQAFVEALCSLLAWSNYGKPSTLSFNIQTRKWYAAEQKRFQSSNSASLGSEDDILRQLSKLLSRIEKFESILHRLLKLIGEGNGDKKTKQQVDYLARISDVETALVKASNGNCKCFSLRRVLSDELNKVSKARSDLARASVLTCRSEGDTSKTLLHLGKRKRRQQSKDLKRKQLRSRNQTVDEWLRSDLQVGQEESMDNDAYVDLEDFIVDG